MKKLPILLFLALLAACAPKEPGPAIISGKALNYTDSIMFLNLDNVRDTIHLNADGSFNKEYDIKKAVYPNLQGNKVFAYLWLEPGKSLSIDFDAADFNNTLTFGGELGAENSYLKAKTPVNSQNYRAINQAYRKPNVASDFRRVCDSVYEAEQKMLDQFVADNGELDEDFIRMEKTALKFSWLGNLQSYPDRIHFYNDSAVVPEDWFAFMDGLVLDDPELLDVPDSKYFLIAVAGEKATKKSGVAREDSWANPDLLRANFEVVKAEFTNPEIVDVILYEKLKQHLDATSPDGISDLITDYLALSTNAERTETIRKQHEDWLVLEKGKPAPAFTVVDMQGNEHKLSDFAGKFVFIDFWATWCGPCKVEIPFLKQIYEDYKDKNLVVMSISVDKDKAAWEKMVTEEGFEWLQFHDGVNMNDLYLVRYIPTFVLIDPDGKLIASRAPNPSDDKLRALLEEVLN